MSSDKKIQANRKNAAKSTGPKTEAGKNHAKWNALKAGFYAREFRIGEEDKPEFEALRECLVQQFVPATPLQEIGFESIVCCIWRSKLALRLETRAMAQHPNAATEPESDENEMTERSFLTQWFGASYGASRSALRFLRDLRADVAENGLLHLEREGSWKDSVISGFGIDFYNSLIEWKGMSATALGLAEHLDEHRKTFRVPQKPNESTVTQQPKEPEVVADPKLKWEMVVKLIDLQILHLLDLIEVSKQGMPNIVPAEFSPRYFAASSRDLQRAVDWYLYVRNVGL